MSTTEFSYGPTTWVNINHPTQEDMDALSKRCPNFHTLNLQDCLTDLEFPKLNHHNGYLFLVVQIPTPYGSSSGYRPAEVDIFIAHGMLVTSHREDLPALPNRFTVLQEDEAMAQKWMGKGASPLLYRLLDEWVDGCFPLVHQVNVQIQQLEKSLFSGNPRQMLSQVAVVRRDVITLRSVLKSQQGVVDTLIHGNWAFIQEDLDPYWGDIADHLAQLCLLLDQDAEVIDGFSDTIDTLASHRIDEVVSLLTVVTVLTMPMTLLTTIFGMNIYLPFADRPISFYLVTGVGILISVWLVWYLRRRRWM